MFTVKQLSTLAGVTPRALHYYDQIGLLKPSRVGDNRYRYYADDALLRLQQILLYRQMDVPLEQIKRILSSPDFDTLTALESHKASLRQRIQNLETLVSTVDNTIQYLKGNHTMSHKQLFAGLSDEQQAAMEKEAMHMYDPAVVKASNQKWKNYSAAEKKHVIDEGNAVYEAMIAAIPMGAASAEAQAGVERWRRHMDYFWTPKIDQLLGLAELYGADPRFKANFDQLDPRLADFMREAVKVYVERHPGQ